MRAPYTTFLLLSFFSCLGSSLKLEPVRSSSTGLAARTDSTAFELKKNETFLWSGASNNRTTLATFTLYTADDSESIIDLDSIESLFSSIRCSNTSITLQAADATAFASLQKTLGWTNQADNNTLIVVAGADQCDWNEDRQPFSISSINFNNATETALLAGSRANWSSIASNYDLHIDALPQADLTRRDDEEDYTLDFNHGLGFGNWTFPVDDTYSIGLTCKTCYTTGDFTFDFDIKTRLDIPVDATLTVTPQGVSAVIDPTVSLSGSLTGSKSFKDTFLRIPIDGITIADIVDLGPEVAFSGSLTIGPVKGTASVTTGVTVSVQDSAEMYIDLLSPSSLTASGWAPNVTGETPSVSASISAGVSLGVLADVEFDITILGKGLSAGIGLQPLVGATLSAIDAIDSSSGACSNDPEHRPYGVQLAPSAGVYLVASVSDVATVTITSETISLSTDCIGFGSPSTSSPASSSTTVLSSSATTSSSVRSTSSASFSSSRISSRRPSTTPSPKPSSASSSRIPSLTPVPKKY